MPDLRGTSGYPCLRRCWCEGTLKYIKKVLAPNTLRSSIYVRAPVTGTYDTKYSSQNLQEGDSDPLLNGAAFLLALGVKCSRFGIVYD